jgi:hypothetical protein
MIRTEAINKPVPFDQPLIKVWVYIILEEQEKVSINKLVKYHHNYKYT